MRSFTWGWSGCARSCAFFERLQARYYWVAAFGYYKSCFGTSFLARTQHLPVHLIFQHARAFEGYHPPWVEHQVVAGLGVPSLSFVFILDLEFPEAANEDGFAGFKAGFDDFQHGFNRLGGFWLGKSALIADAFDEVGFGERHGRPPY